MTRLARPLLLLCLLPLTGCGKGGDAPTPAVAPDAKPAVAVQVGPLEREFLENGIAANEKYRDRVLDVTGYAVMVTDHEDGRGLVSLADFFTPLPQDRTWEAGCVFNAAEKGQLAPVKPGDKVIVRGLCRGLWKGRVLLEGCRLIDHGPPEKIDVRDRLPPRNTDGALTP